tara:strand:- start:3857 stop:4663 length:807 start_codon:yes stop_codon:yes gene_type:complete
MNKKKLYVSNLCWRTKNISFIINVIKRENFSGIDFAPLNYFDSWKNILDNSKKLNKIFKKENIKINAIQGIFFKKNLNLFEIDQRKKITNHFKLIIKLCRIFNSKKIVLGSSSFRNPKNLEKKSADSYFISYFKYLNQFLKKNRIYLCIETIPKNYKEKYIFRFSKLVYLISKINSSNIKINFDTSLFHYSKFDKKIFLKNLKKIKNIQISQPKFTYFSSPTKKNLAFLKLLKKNEKIKDISLEIIDKKLNKIKFIQSVQKLKSSLYN